MTREATTPYVYGAPEKDRDGVEYLVVHGGPRYAIARAPAGRIIHGVLYRNVGRGVAIVAAGPDTTGKWAAYIGAAATIRESEEATMLGVAKGGAKLDRETAARLLQPELIEHLGGIGRYRD